MVAGYITLLQKAFLLYSPLNQGLKQVDIPTNPPADIEFLLYSPLNQGLKLKVVTSVIAPPLSFYSTVH